MRFALEHPNHYRLMYSPELPVPPAAAQEAHDLPHGILERCAAQGRLRVPPAPATQMIMSGNVGAALSMLTRPEQYVDPKFARRQRDAVLDSVARPADTEAAREDGSVPVAAATLAARLRADLPPALTTAESALLQQWLVALSGSRKVSVTRAAAAAPGPTGRPSPRAGRGPGRPAWSSPGGRGCARSAG